MNNNARKTHCKHGHALTGENLYIDKDEVRRCRACMKRNNDKSNKTARDKRNKQSFSDLEYGDET